VICAWKKLRHVKSQPLTMCELDQTSFTQLELERSSALRPPQSSLREAEPPSLNTPPGIHRRDCDVHLPHERLAYSVDQQPEGFFVLSKPPIYSHLGFDLEVAGWAREVGGIVSRARD
jgi:hypothetical protein